MDGYVSMAINNPYARFNQLELKRWIAAVNKVSSVLKTEKVGLPYRNAVEFSHLVVNNISTQKYAGGYAPLNTRYREWKEQYGRSGKEFWALFNNLIQRISAFKVKGGWMGGIESGMMVGGTSWFGRGNVGHLVDVAEYARWLEEGRKGQPARPLFAPTTEEYWEDGFFKKGAESLRKIKGAWR